MKIEIKTGPVQIVSHSYELLDRILLRACRGESRGSFALAGHVLWENRPDGGGLCP